MLLLQRFDLLLPSVGQFDLVKYQRSVTSKGDKTRIITECSKVLSLLCVSVAAVMSLSGAIEQTHYAATDADTSTLM